MGLDLNTALISDTFDGLIKTTDGNVLTSSPLVITDGRGNDSSLALATAGNGVAITGTLTVGGVDIGSDLSTAQSDITAIEAKTDFITVTGAVNLDTINTKAGFITVTQAVDLDTIESDIAVATAKTDYITVTQAVNLDTMESDILSAKTKTDYITISQAVNLDTVESGLATAQSDITAIEAKTDFITVTGNVNLNTIASNASAAKTKTDFLTVTQAVDLDTLESDVNVAKGDITAIEAKTDNISVTQAVNLDTMESDIADAKTKTDFITITQAVNLDTVESGLSQAQTDINLIEAKTNNITVTQAVNLDTMESDIATNNAKNSYPAADATKVGFISVTQAVDLDSIETDVANLSSNKYDKTGGTISGNVVVTGDLTVNGTTTTVNTQTLSVEDPLIELANQNSANTVDTGFYANYSLDAGVTTKYAGLFKDASDSDKFKLFKGLEVEPTSSVNTSGTGYAKGDLVVNDLDAVTISGALTGDVTGDLTGTVLTAAQPNITSVGTLSSLAVSGDLTVDTDTLFVDASANTVGIGTDTPIVNLHIKDSGAIIARLESTTDDNTTIHFGDSADADVGKLTYAHSDNSMQFVVNALERMRITSDGDLYFPKNNGTTLLSATDNFGNIALGAGDGGSGTLIEPHLFVKWGGNVGIGTSSPATLFEISANNNGSLNNALRITDSDTFVSSGDPLGAIEFYATDGAKVSSSIKALYESSQGGSDLTFNVSTGANAQYEAMRIDASSGNVGIGTSSPSVKLDVDGGNVTNPARFVGTADKNLWVYTDSGGVGIGTGTGGAGAANYSSLIYLNDIDSNTRFFTAGSERLRIDSSGNVGIGTSTTTAKLDVRNNSNRVLKVIQEDTNLSSNTYTFEVDSSSQVSNMSAAGAMAVDVNSGRAFTITGSGNVGIGTSSPASKLYVNAGSDNYAAIFESTDATSLISFKDNNSASILANYVGVITNDLVFGTNSSERLRIDASGNVGIGTSSPQSLLHVSAPKPTYTDSGVVFRGGTTNNNAFSGISLISAGDALGGTIGSNFVVDGTTTSQTNTNRSSGYIQFSNTTSAGTTSNIDFGGLVKGTTTKVLCMRTYNVGGSTQVILDSPSGGNTTLQFAENGTTDFSQWLNSSTSVLNIVDADFSNGVTLAQNSNAWGGYSDERLKQNITETSLGLDTILALKPVEYEWKKESKKDIGFIAQDLKQVSDYFATGDDSVTEYGEHGELLNPMIAYETKLIPVLVKAIQELKAEIELLKTTK